MCHGKYGYNSLFDVQWRPWPLGEGAVVRTGASEPHEIILLAALVRYGSSVIIFLYMLTDRLQVEKLHDKEIVVTRRATLEIYFQNVWCLLLWQRTDSDDEDNMGKVFNISLAIFAATG